MNKDIEYPVYIGKDNPNCDYHNGQIMPCRGVKCYQIVRANRMHPEYADNTASTYKHAPDLAYFGNHFYCQYLCNPKDEHSGAGYSVLASSRDAKIWDDYKISFPTYKIPACERIDYKGLKHIFSGDTYAFMHQRMSFYKSRNGHMLVLGFYGWSKDKCSTNWDNYGIGRVVRELYIDGSLGPVYFIRVNKQAGWMEEDYLYPQYSASDDTGFVEACNELLDDNLYCQQWAEENGDIDPIIKIKHPGNGKTYQAFCWYHIDDKKVVALWKHSLTAVSTDNGKSFSEIKRSPSLVMSGQKIWGQKTSDNKFMLVYDPTLETEHRYPMCIVTSDDGIHYDNMRLIHGEVPIRRYEGFWKDFGPQYMRGITEGIVDDGVLKNAYVVYSVNKEDIWIAEIPVPVMDQNESDINEVFTEDSSLQYWNIYSPKWADIHIDNDSKGMKISCSDPYDYAAAARMLKSCKKAHIEFAVIPRQNNYGVLYVELTDEKSKKAVRLVFRADGWIYARTVIEIKVCKYDKDSIMNIGLDISCDTNDYTISINKNHITNDAGEKVRWSFMQAVNSICQFKLRTGAERIQPNLEMSSENTFLEDAINSDVPCMEYSYDVLSFICLT